MSLLEHSSVVCAGLVVLSLSVAYVGTAWLRLASIPTVGGSDLPILSYRGSYNFIVNGKALLQEGYERYKGRPFKIAMLDRWMVCLSGSPLVDELRKLPNDAMSFSEAIRQLLEGDYTFGLETIDNPWHAELVRTHLTKKLDGMFPDVRDEVASAFDEYIGSAEAGWVDVPMLDTVRQVICRASNRIFVGLPKCREQDWINLNIEFTLDVTKCRIVLNFFPPFLKPLAGRMLTTVPAKLKRAMYHLEPIIEGRRQKMMESGKDYADKPNDMLQWFLEDERGMRSSVKDLSLRMLAINFAAVHTSSNVCTHSLYTLAANPEYLVPLREEIESVTREHGWTKSSMTEMVKLDSFLKECTRRYIFTAFGLLRLALKSHKFADGTQIPAGTLVCVPLEATHGDNDNFDRAGEFLPFRFAEGDGKDVTAARQFTSTSIEYLTFGHGKQACPGRFFASNEIKVMLAHLIVNYDFRTETEGVRPADRYLGPSRLPNPTAKISFRKRAD